jgi:hypothetical protein
MPVEIDMSTPEGVTWVKSQNDAELWHTAAMAVIAWCRDDHGFLPWLVEQPSMDRATAGWLFLWPEGSLYLLGKTETFALLDYSSEAEMVALLRALSERSETLGFARDEIGLDPGFEAERQNCLEIIARRDVADGLPNPHRLLSRKFASPIRSRYTIEEGGAIEMECD